MEMNTAIISNTALRGFAAGAIGVTAMDYLVTWPMYKIEDSKAYEKEKELQPEGKWAGHVGVKKLSNALGADLSEDKIFYAGKINHYMIGMAPAALYALYYNQVPILKSSKGLLFGLGLFILMDEIVTPALGLSGPTTKYPWQAHARGLLGHLMFGVATHFALEVMNKKNGRISN